MLIFEFNLFIFILKSLAMKFTYTKYRERGVSRVQTHIPTHQMSLRNYHQNCTYDTFLLISNEINSIWEASNIKYEYLS